MVGSVRGRSFHARPIDLIGGPTDRTRGTGAGFHRAAAGAFRVRRRSGTAIVIGRPGCDLPCSRLESRPLELDILLSPSMNYFGFPFGELLANDLPHVGTASATHFRNAPSKYVCLVIRLPSSQTKRGAVPRHGASELVEHLMAIADPLDGGHLVIVSQARTVNTGRVASPIIRTLQLSRHPK